MKLIFLIPLFALLASCEQKVGLIKVYSEISNHLPTEEYPTTGAKVILLENVTQYSTVKVLSCQAGEVTELAREDLEESTTGSYAYSLRLYPNNEGIPTWIYRYRGNGGGSTSRGISYETLTDGWEIINANSSRSGRLDEKVEILDCFVLRRNLAEFPFQAEMNFDPYASIEDQQATSKKHPKIKIIILTLE
ncbi:MAG: hypothetical protein ACJAVK_003443 [Akkermansiaceae bacterium]|jgi:hypothetical protein